MNQNKKSQTHSKNYSAQLKTRFNENLDSILKTRKMTRNKLSDKSGVSVGKFRKDETGQLPSIESAIKIADTLKVSLDELFGRSQYCDDVENWSAGKCLDVLYKLVKKLYGTFEEPNRILLAKSNVTKAIRDCNDFVRHIEAAKKLGGKYNMDSVLPQSTETAKEEWIKGRINELMGDDIFLFDAPYDFDPLIETELDRQIEELTDDYRWDIPASEELASTEAQLAEENTDENNYDLHIYPFDE